MPASGTFTEVGSATGNACALGADGTITCWGDNTYGESTPPSGSFAHLSIGDLHSCALKPDGEVVCWGTNTSGERTPPAGKFVQVTAGGRIGNGYTGSSHNCALAADGTVTCWGDNSWGQGTPPPDVRFVQISAADSYTCGVSDAQQVWCWGFYARQPLW
jgi:alpha-tubulin suppressor-like RCC1 family protein